MLGEEAEQELERECIFFLTNARNVVCIMPCACQPYAAVVVFHFNSMDRYLKQEEQGLFVWVWRIDALSYSCSRQTETAMLRADCSGWSEVHMLAYWVSWRKMSLDTTESLRLLVKVSARDNVGIDDKKGQILNTEHGWTIKGFVVKFLVPV